MSLLTAPQKAAIAAGAPTRQVWYIIRCTAAGSAPSSAVLLHDDVYPAYTRVTDAGQYTAEGYNQSIAAWSTVVRTVLDRMRE
jgi:hypothetical protein